VFAVARADGTIGIFEVSSPSAPTHQLTAESRVESMAFSNDGYLLAVVFAQKKLALYHVLNGALLMRNDAMIEQPLSVSFGENDQLVGYCEINGQIFGWDLHHNLVAHQHT
jgi:WD40 repeat protein